MVNDHEEGCTKMEDGRAGCRRLPEVDRQGPGVQNPERPSAAAGRTDSTQPGRLISSMMALPCLISILLLSLSLIRCVSAYAYPP
mmetsp:Transcript_21023/g.45514  ORF Transcript_21023/g.45514 Transcript_21023/m.45514 type:complete len:85 (-) Transcript_21023:338-592(-)